MADGVANIKQIVNTILEQSAELLAGNSSLDENYIRLIEQSEELVNAWKDYEKSMEAYNETVKQKASLKRDIKRLEKGQSVRSGMSLESASAALDKVRRAQDDIKSDEKWLKSAEAALRHIYDLIFALQQTVNAVVNQSIEMVYVTTRSGKAQIVKLDHEIFQDLYSLDVDRNGRLILRYNVASIETTIKEMHEQQRAKTQVITALTGPMQTLYAEIERRYSAAEARGNKVLLYQQNGKYYAAKFSAFGDVLEAYVDAVVNGNADPSATSIFSRSLDDQIAWFINAYVTKVDSASGFAQEDVKVGSSNLFFGVKSAGASLMGISLVVKFAQLVVNSARGKATKKDVNSVANKFKGSSKTRTAITEVTQAEYDVVVKETTEELVAPLEGRH